MKNIYEKRKTKFIEILYNDKITKLQEARPNFTKQ